MADDDGMTPDEVASRIRGHIQGDDAVRVLKKYYSGSYTGALFDHSEALRSDDPDRFTAHDLVAVATLSVALPGRAVEDVLSRNDSLSELLRAVPDKPLVSASDEDLDRLYELQQAFRGMRGIGHVTRSKLLAHKRPQLVPIRDQFVLQALIGKRGGSFTKRLRDALGGHQDLLTRLEVVQNAAGQTGLAAIRALDVIVWMREHGDSQVDT